METKTQDEQKGENIKSTENCSGSGVSNVLTREHRVSAGLGWKRKNWGGRGRLLTFQWTHFYSHTIPNSLLMIRALRQSGLGIHGGWLRSALTQQPSDVYSGPDQLFPLRHWLPQSQEVHSELTASSVICQKTLLSAKSLQAEDLLNTN